MEFLLLLLILSALLIFSVYLLKRKYDHRLLSEQNKASSLLISESQLKQKNNLLSEDLEIKKREAEHLIQKIETLEKNLQALSSAESSARQRVQEAGQQLAQQKQLHSSDNAVEHELMQLHTTIERQAARLQQLQNLLHDAQVTHTIAENIFKQKEDEFRHKVEMLTATIHTQRSELVSTTEGLHSEHSARQSIEQDKMIAEHELQEKSSVLEAELLLLKDEYQKLNEAFQEENKIRLATEHALQESKEKLYNVIHEQKEKLAEHETVISLKEEQLHDTQQKISHLENAISSIINEVPICAFVTNNEGVCSFINPALQTTIGYSREDIEGRHFSKMFPEDERSFYEEQWNASLNRTEEFKGEASIATSMADIISVDLNIVEIINGTEKAYVGFVFDKTIEHEANKHYKEAKKHEEELLHLKSRFISMVTHQLRTALVTVATNTELLERFALKWPEEKRYRSFFRINESLRQMMELLQNVETSTSPASAYEPKYKKINLESVAQAVATDVKHDLEAKQNFIFSEQGNISSVMLDETLVKTVLVHILSNAFKFSSDDSTVKLHISQNDSLCTFTIIDNGIGIPFNEQQFLFTSFFRASNVGALYGTGLGLTIAQQYVRLAGGTISIESQVNKGTTVTFTLPIQE